MSRKNIIILALLVSAGINLFFVGGIVSRVSNNGSREVGIRSFPPNISWVVRDLDEARRDELRPILRQSYEEIRPIRGEMFAAQRRVNELMASQAFDAAALDQAFAALRDVSDRYQALSHQQTISLLGELSEEERQMAQEFVQRRGPRDGRDGRDGFRGRDGRPGFGGGFGPDGSGRPGGPGRPPFDAPPPPADPDQ